MKKGIRTAAIAILAILIVSVGSASAMFHAQNPETISNRIVEIADEASQRVGDLIDFICSNLTALEMIDTAGLAEEFENNVTLYDEGLENVTNAHSCLATEDYEGAIANATEALSIFREVYSSLHVILCNSDVKMGPLVDVNELEEAIDRALERIEELQALISTEAPIYNNLIDANELLTVAKNELLPDYLEDAKANMKEANILISEVCQYLKQVAQGLNPSRITSYLDEAYQYRYRFRERFGQAQDEGFDVDGFLQTFGYQNEEEFMTRFQEMIKNAQETEDIEDVIDELEEIGRLIREMDQNLTQEMGHHRAQYGQLESGGGFGQEASGSGYGQEGSGSGYGQEGNSGEFVQSNGSYGGGDNSGQMGFRGGQ